MKKAYHDLESPWDLWEARHINRSDSTRRSAGAPRIMEIGIECLLSSWGKCLWGGLHCWYFLQSRPALCSPLRYIKVIWLLILETKVHWMLVTHLHEAAETSLSTGDNHKAPYCCLLPDLFAAMLWVALKSTCSLSLCEKEEMARSLSLMLFSKVPRHWNVNWSVVD